MINRPIGCFPAGVRLRGLCLGLGAAAALALPPAAQAIDWGYANWGSSSVDSLSYWSYSDMSRRSAQRQRALASGQSKSTISAPKTQSSALSTASNVSASGQFRDERGLDGLAAMYPRDQFFERKTQFRQIVQGFNQNVQKLYGVPANNLATGLTVVLAGAYAAYHNQPFPDAWVKPLYQQMEGLLLQDSRLHQRSTVGKAADYQVMVGAGMAMMLTQAELQKAPDAKVLQQLRDTGADALRTLFKADPQQVEFTRSGLQVR